MQPTLCSRCHKNVAVIFISKLEGGETKNEGLCSSVPGSLAFKPSMTMNEENGQYSDD